MKKSLQIFLGFLSWLGMAITGILMSGQLVFVEQTEFYETGYLIWIFPAITAAVLILAGRYARLSENRAYFISFGLFTVLPYVMYPLTLALAEVLPSGLCNFPLFSLFTVLVYIPYIPLFSVYGALLDIIAFRFDGWCMILYFAVFTLPMTAGFIGGFITMNRKKKAKPEEFIEEN